MANIRKRGNKWQVQIRRAGHSSITKTFHRREEAIAWGRSQEVRLDASEAGIALPVKETLTELLGRYAVEITPQKKSAASESRRIARLFKDPISQYRICDLTPETLAKFRDRRLLDGQRAAAYDLQIIRHVLNIASSEWGMNIKENPLNNVRFPAPPRPRDRRLKPGELEVLLAAAKESGSAYMPALILLAVETGMRAGEMLKLKWADWSEEEATIHLRDTKNGRDRL
ncbi:MAG: tyrosine-type recombinase/integrase, partial [Alphaproteobacteria bacterium]|nr:tyrosine-type recombinase/integrase [Alphaproteobacteria bacterium]